MRLIQVAPILGIQDEYAARIAQLGLKLSMPMWIGFLGFLSYLSYVPGLEDLGLQRISGFFGFFGFSGFLGLFGVASMMDSYRRGRSVQ
jgi:hypothetical protein